MLADFRACSGPVSVTMQISCAAARSRHISANGLSLRRLRFAQALDGRDIARIARQMESAEPLDRHDLTGGEPLLRFCDRDGERGTAHAGRRSAARGTGGWPDPRTRRWHSSHSRKRAHGRVRPIVRDVLDDGVARSAIGAVREGIAGSADWRDPAKSAQAGIAGRDIGRDQRELPGLCDALADDEAGIVRQAGISATSISRIRASGGGSVVIVRRKESTAATEPSASATNPEDELRA